MESMTGRTHDLGAFTALNVVVLTIPVPQMTIPTTFVAVSANFIGALVPDIDQQTSMFWKNVRGGGSLAVLISPLLGGHRFISHSILGIAIFGFLSKLLFNTLGSFILVDMQIVWISFMIGYISHLVMDTTTKEGVAWFFPIPWRIGMPPVSFFRVKTGGLVEKVLVFPGLVFLNGYLIYSYYPKYLEFLKNLIR